MYHIIASFLERYEEITYQLWVASDNPDLRHLTEPCYVPLSELPRLSSVNYTQSTSPLHANAIQPCDPQKWSRILPEGPTHFRVSFLSGKLIPFVPTNPRNDRVYYRRVATTSSDDSIFWFTLFITVGKPLQAFHPQVRLINWGYSHLLEHKSLFLTPALQVQNTPILYVTPITNDSPHDESQPNFMNVFPFQVSFTNPPSYWTQRIPYRGWCDTKRIQESHQPYGSLEIDLLKILPPPTHMSTADNYQTFIILMYRILIYKNLSKSAPATRYIFFQVLCHLTLATNYIRTLLFKIKMFLCQLY